MNLVASASGVPADAMVTYTWTGPFVTATGKTAVVQLPLGTHTITLTVSNGTGVSVTDQFVVIIADTTPPVPDSAIGHTIEATAAAGTPFALVAGGSDSRPGHGARVAGAHGLPIGRDRRDGYNDRREWEQRNGTVTVTVVDTTAPLLSLPPDVVVTATGALTQVAIGLATATDIFGAAVNRSAPPELPDRHDARHLDRR